MKGVGLALTLLASVLVAGCSGGETTATPVDSSSCSKVLYEGEGKPQAIIVSDLPLRASTQEVSSATVRVIEGVLRRRGFRAGDHRVGYQSCNSTVGADSFDEGACRRNAQAYAATKDVLGLIGPYFSACAAVEIPILSRTGAGPLAMVSAANTDPGLTRETPFSDRDPGSLYTDGVRNYVRVVPSDDALGAAVAVLAKQIGARRVVALVNSDQLGFGWYGPALGAGFVETARSLGLVTTKLEWRDQPSYEALATRARAARPQLVFLAGQPVHNARRLLEDLRRGLGPEVVFAAGDAFLTVSPEEFGPAVEGLRFAVNHLPPEGLTPAARRYLRSVGQQPEHDGQIGVAEAAPATEVLLDAIARSDGTRASVVQELFATKVESRTLGSFSFDRRGDITPASVALYSIRDGEVVFDEVVRVPSRAP